MLGWDRPLGSPRTAGAPSRPWTPRSRLLVVGGALVATAPAWPLIQPREPIADEMLSPAEVAVIVPVVLVFPVAWALLGRSRRIGWRVGAALVGCVAVWSLGTVRLASYATPPTVDDALRWYLISAGIVVAAAAAVEWFWQRAEPQQAESERARSEQAESEQPRWPGRLRFAAGLAVWAVGVVVTLAVPVVDGQMVPPRDALTPLPPTMIVVDEEMACQRRPVGGRSCVRRFTIAARDQVIASSSSARAQELTRRLGRHLEQDGWRLTWHHFGTGPTVECRPVGRLADPYRLCVDVRVDESRSVLEVQLAYSNLHDPIHD